MLTPLFKREQIGLLPAHLGAAKVISLHHWMTVLLLLFDY